jgi:hypothetical protein
MSHGLKAGEAIFARLDCRRLGRKLNFSRLRKSSRWKERNERARMSEVDKGTCDEKLQSSFV